MSDVLSTVTPSETSAVLLERCLSARREGADFPYIWHSILKGHSLVAGLPTHSVRGGRITLEVPLICGQRLVCDEDNGEFSLY